MAEVLLGLDLSLTASAAFAVPLDWDGEWSRVRSCVVGEKLRKDASDAERARRTETIAARLVAFARATGATKAFIEGYAYGLKTSAHSLGELGGVVRLELVRAGLELVTVPMQTARKLLLGRCPKQGAKVAVAEALRAAGARFEGLDESDAFAVLNWGMSELGGYCFVVQAPGTNVHFSVQPSGRPAMHPMKAPLDLTCGASEREERMSEESPDRQPLTFVVAPHIVEDLGLNLYTDLPRVLVEFIANAYDADATSGAITLDKSAIDTARRIAKQEHKLESERHRQTLLERSKRSDADDLPPVPDVEPLASRSLPDTLSISIVDNGVGMTRDELQRKFLIAGRRRRLDGDTSTLKGRAVMGRKGLGKLAGFGVARKVIVTTLAKGETRATRIVLDYKELTKRGIESSGYPVQETQVDAPELYPHGTRIELTELIYEPAKSKNATIERELQEHFYGIKPEDFEIRVNASPVPRVERAFAFSWPNPDWSADMLVNASVREEDDGTEDSEPSGPSDPDEHEGAAGRSHSFKYRIRFVELGKGLRSSERGVRVYAHNRLACAPTLLDADTNVHGFRMTDYLEGVVEADFLDEQGIDYIATDRQSLRWDTPVLSPLRTFLSEKIAQALREYQKSRDEAAPRKVEDDPFTIEQLQRLTKSQKRMATRIAIVLQKSCENGTEDPLYKSTLPEVVRGLWHGQVLTAISRLALEDNPNLRTVAHELAKLTRDANDEFVVQARARLEAIGILQRIVQAKDFKEKQNEKELQKLFEKNPWIIDPSYSQVVAADRSFSHVLEELEKELCINDCAPPDAETDEERPDLVFLLSLNGQAEIAVIELKSANLPLETKHHDQLLQYMDRIQDWLTLRGKTARITGQLIGSFAPVSSKVRGVAALRTRLANDHNVPWKIRDYLHVLEHTKAVHETWLGKAETNEEVLGPDDR